VHSVVSTILTDILTSPCSLGIASPFPLRIARASVASSLGLCRRDHGGCKRTRSPKKYLYICPIAHERDNRDFRDNPYNGAEIGDRITGYGQKQKRVFGIITVAIGKVFQPGALSTITVDGVRKTNILKARLPVRRNRGGGNFTRLDLARHRPGVAPRAAIPYLRGQTQGLRSPEAASHQGWLSRVTYAFLRRLLVRAGPFWTLCIAAPCRNSTDRLRILVSEFWAGCPERYYRTGYSRERDALRCEPAQTCAMHGKTIRFQRVISSLPDLSPCFLLRGLRRIAGDTL
jgi:hypothetical protein